MNIDQAEMNEWFKGYDDGFSSNAPIPYDVTKTDEYIKGYRKGKADKEIANALSRMIKSD